MRRGAKLGGWRLVLAVALVGFATLAVAVTITGILYPDDPDAAKRVGGHIGRLLFIVWICVTGGLAFAKRQPGAKPGPGTETPGQRSAGSQFISPGDPCHSTERLLSPKKGHQMAMVFCRGCGKEIHDSAPTCPHCGAPQAIPSIQDGPIPDGVKGWSWGAFLLNWIWAAGNRTWWGLLALVPYVGLIVAIWLGIKGREMAWKNGSWDSLEHFIRVQKRWSQWALGIVAVAVIGILAAIVIPAYQDYGHRGGPATRGSQPI